jgi:hypothetical protein
MIVDSELKKVTKVEGTVDLHLTHEEFAAIVGALAVTDIEKAQSYARQTHGVELRPGVLFNIFDELDTILFKVNKE